MGNYFWDKFKNVFGVGLSIAKADFKLINEGTWLGVLWYLLAPILTFILLLNIFQDRLGYNIPNYPLYLFLGIMLFNYFQKIASGSVSVIRENVGVIKSINFSKESLICSVVFKTFFSHIFEIIILIVFLIFFGVNIGAMIFYPIILVFLSFFCLGFGLILASLGAYFFDLIHIWGFSVTLIWLATPIFYAIGGQTRLFYLNLFNPMFYFITVARDLIIYVRMPELWMILGLTFYSLLFLFIGLYMFDKLKPRFAEVI